MERKYEQVGTALTCRSFEEYARMFAFGRPPEPPCAVLDAAAGASSFTAEAARRGLAAVAVDPRYGLPEDVLYEEARTEIDVSTAKLDGLRDLFDFSYYGSLENHRAGREASLEQFIADFAADRREGGGRYVAGELPHLPFDDERFDLVLCSHFLFLYGEHFDYDFHEQAVLELLRVLRPGGEARIYPLVTLSFREYPHLDRLTDRVREAGCEVEFPESRLPFIPGSHRLMTIRKPAETDAAGAFGRA
jgi:SAM-dependent methyltransferase